MSLFLIFATAACGDESTPNPDACADVECARGVCLEAQCVNPEQCAGDDACLAGYQCSGGVCVVTEVCDADGRCERGVCQSGACVNPTSCSTNDQCVSDYFCDEGSCAPDPCATTTCERGICQLGTGECVNASACTSSNEGVVCLDDHRCLDGSCVERDAFCEELDCQLGVCDFEAGECVDSERCTQNSECLAGSYCAEDGTCKLNLCDAQMTTCELGLCDPDSGECVNAESCDSTDDCLNGFLCVGDACVEAGAACGEGGCPGNQICEYDAGARSATCLENTQQPCSSALDCAGERVCADGACAEPTACVADAFEPNDAASDATSFQSEAASNRLSASLCTGDVDLYRFDTSIDSDLDGTLLVDLAIAPEDLGVGVVTVELLDATGTAVATASTESGGAPTTSARVEYVIDANNQGLYTVSVSGDVTTAGVDYLLAIDLVDAAAAEACTSVPVINGSATVSGDTSAASSTGLTSSCLDSDGSLGDQVYELVVPQDSHATIRLLPNSNVDLGVSIRASCTQELSELQNGCVDGGGRGSVEQLQMQLDAGSYYLLVEPYTSTSGGSYTLSVALEALVCTPADDTCADASRINACNEFGTGFDVETCENGCDLSANRCVAAPGDICATAIVVDPTTGYSGSIDYQSFTNDYDPGSGGCVPGNSTSSTDGPDAVFEVTVPAGHAAVAEIEQPGSRYIAAYALTDCADVANSCVAAANDGGYSSADETLVYENTSAGPQKIYIVADSEDYASTASGEIAIQVLELICTPGVAECAGPGLDRESRICNAMGTGYATTTTCDNGCEQSTGVCVSAAHDLCGAAVDITPSLVSGAGTSSTSGSFGLFKSDYTTGGCDVGTGAPGNGDDGVYMITGLPAATLVTVELTSNDDTVLWVTESCTAEQTGSCIVGADATGGADSNTETVTFLAEDAKTYFIVADLYFSSTEGGAFTLDVEVEPPACLPGEFLGCNAALDGIETCNEFGQIDTYTCQGGCDGATERCGVPTGDVCADPLAATGLTGQFTGTHADGTNALEAFSSTVGGCYFEWINDGPETIIAFDLQAGDLLELSFDTTIASFYDAHLYILNSCGDFDSCFGEQDQEGDRNLDFVASTTQTYFVVVDSETTSSSSWTLDYTITPNSGRACNAGTRSCYDQFTAEVCNADGTQLDLVYCAGGCANGVCLAEASADVCATAPDAGRGMTIAIDPSLGFVDDIDFPSGNGCWSASYGSDGEEAIYSVTLQPFETVEVTAFASGSSTWPIGYIFTDCADPIASCLAGEDGTSSENGVASYTNGDTAQTVYVGLDADGSMSRTYRYEIAVIEPECLPSDPRSCDAAATSVTYCEDGALVNYACADSCFDGACVTPRGDACFDAIALAGATGTTTGDWVNNQNEVEPGEDLQGACVFDLSAAGADDIYLVSLQPGELLEVELRTAEADAVVYIVDDCASPADTCLAGGFVDPMRASYLAPAAADVFVIVDRDDSGTGETYELDWSVSAGALCAPSASVCVDAATVAVCNEAGTAYAAQYTCPNGCADGACSVDLSADSCASAPLLIDGVYSVASFADFTNAAEPSSSSCVGRTMDGPDFFFQVPLQANNILRVTMDASDPSTWPGLYVFTDCSDAAGSCLAGDSVTSGVVTVEYQAGADGNVYVGVDSDHSTTTSAAILEVEILDPDCIPGSFVRQCNADATAVEYCDASGFTREYACQGVGTCTNGRCDEPVGDVCFDAFDANPAPGESSVVLTGTLGDFNDDYQLSTGNMCTGSVTPAADAVYVVDLVAGQTLSASLFTTATSAEDLALYITPNCEDIAGWCVAGADAVAADPSTAEVASYTASADETLFVVVDSYFAASSGAYELTIDVQ